MKLLPSLALLLVACAHPAAPPDHPGSRDPLAPDIDKLATAAIDTQATAGVSVAVVRADQVVFAKGYGFADLAGKRPADPSTVYRIGSLTKQFTAAAIVQLAEAGKLDLDADVRTLVDVPTGGQPVTIRQLLHHTSGMPDYTELPSFVTEMPRPHTPAQIVALVKDVPWKFAPGSKFEYSNTGYVVLGMVIEKVSAEPYAAYLATHVFSAAHLTSTSYCDESRPDAHRATGYEQRAGLVPAHPIDLSIAFSAGALCSTVLDLARWDTALRTGRVVSPAGYAQMTTPTLGDYGFGLFKDERSGHVRVHHNGGINGFVAELDDYPADHVVLVVLANTESPVPQSIELAVARLALHVPSSAVPIAPAELAAYAGTYVIPGLGEAVFTVVGDHLAITVTGQPTFPMEHRGHDGFAVELVGATLTFGREAGVVTKVTLVQGGATVEAPRKAP